MYSPLFAGCCGCLFPLREPDASGFHSLKGPLRKSGNMDMTHIVIAHMISLISIRSTVSNGWKLKLYRKLLDWTKGFEDILLAFIDKTRTVPRHERPAPHTYSET